jgi:hypothetical protein
VRPETFATWTQWNQTAATAGNVINLYGDYQTAHTSALTAESWKAEYWYRWVNQQEETAEQRAERQRIQAQHDQRARDYAAVRKAAAERAERLLEACLTSGQREQLQKNGWFVVYSKSGRAYQIRRGRARNVVEVNTRRTYCCHPVDNVPDADTMLAQKLMIESQEDEFLRTANVS